MDNTESNNTIENMVRNGLITSNIAPVVNDLKREIEQVRKIMMYNKLDRIISNIKSL